MNGSAGISRTTALRDPRKMPVTRGRLAAVAALSALVLFAAAGCGSGGSATAHATASPGIAGIGGQPHVRQ